MFPFHFHLNTIQINIGLLLIKTFEYLFRIVNRFEYYYEYSNETFLAIAFYFSKALFITKSLLTICKHCELNISNI